MDKCDKWDFSHSPTQGEKPAEARAALESMIIYYGTGAAIDPIMKLVDEYVAALSSPQEGATAVGAETPLLNAARHHLQADGALDRRLLCDGVNEAAARIEALQRQVEYNANLAADWIGDHDLQKDRAEAAESSLRTLGDALRHLLERIELDGEMRIDPDFNDADRAALEQARAALTPPTQEPATPSSPWTPVEPPPPCWTLAFVITPGSDDDPPDYAVARLQPNGKWYDGTIYLTPSHYMLPGVPSAPSDKGADE